MTLRAIRRHHRKQKTTAGELNLSGSIDIFTDGSVAHGRATMGIYIHGENEIMYGNSVIGR